MSQIIDRRLNDKGKSTTNRRKFVKRVRDQVKEAVKKAITDGKIEDVIDKTGKKIRIPGKGLNKPNFQHTDGGASDRTYPGNKEFNQGDRIKRPEGGGAGGEGGDASDSGEGEDGFEFQLSREEFLDYFFEDLELPDLIKKEISKTEDFTWHRRGFSVDGNPSRLNIVRTARQSKGRRFALRAPKKRKLKKLEEELRLLNEKIDVMEQAGDDVTDLLAQRTELEKQIKGMIKKIKAIPYIDDVDLRYNRWAKEPNPTTQAVMFSIMDVSASMGEWEKEMSKRFFMLLYLFLTRNYERVDIVFIRHHTSAAEVDEEEFFHSKETGGTLVSTSIQLMKEIIAERYNPAQWNIFGCQCSDGDNWPDDSNKTVELMTNSILPIAQYFAYIEIDKRGGEDSDLWPYYQKLADGNKNFKMRVVSDVSDIYPVFRGLFEKRD